MVFFEAGEVKEGGPGLQAQEPRLSSGVGGGWIKPSTRLGPRAPSGPPPLLSPRPLVGLGCCRRLRLRGWLLGGGGGGGGGVRPPLALANALFSASSRGRARKPVVFDGARRVAAVTAAQLVVR